MENKTTTKQTQKKSQVKEKMLDYINLKKMPKNKFYESSGISRGTLESNSSVTEDIIYKFKQVFPEISIGWLFGESEEMLLRKKTNIDEESEQQVAAKNIRGNVNTINTNNTNNHNYYAECNTEQSNNILEKELQEKNRQITEKDKQIEKLLNIIDNVKNK